MSAFPGPDRLIIGENSIKTTFEPNICYLDMKESWTVIYDGQCRLCSRSVRWIKRNDVRRSFRCIPWQVYRQGEEGEHKGGLDPAWDLQDPADTVLLIRGAKVYVRSSAILRIALRLRFPWPMLGMLFLVPPLIRDAVYKQIARNRTSWFGEESGCYIP